MSSISFSQPYALTVAQLHEWLPLAGLQVTVSFQMAGSALDHVCATPDCHCGLAVLLVYGDDPRPATLWVRGQADESWVSVDSTYGYRVSAEFERRLKRAIPV